MSLNNIRKSRFFQKNAYVSVDFLNRSHEYIRMDSNKIPNKNSSFQNTKTIPEESVMIQTQNNTGVNPIEEELKSFINSIATNINPTVDLESAKMALKLTIDIMEQITMAQN
jgi:predicted dehydrogenase